MRRHFGHGLHWSWPVTLNEPCVRKTPQHPCTQPPYPPSQHSHTWKSHPCPPMVGFSRLWSRDAYTYIHTYIHTTYVHTVSFTWYACVLYTDRQIDRWIDHVCLSVYISYTCQHTCQPTHVGHRQINLHTRIHVLYTYIHYTCHIIHYRWFDFVSFHISHIIYYVLYIILTYCTVYIICYMLYFENYMLYELYAVHCKLCPMPFTIYVICRI